MYLRPLAASRRRWLDSATYHHGATTPRTEAGLRSAERALQEVQLAADVAALDGPLHDRMVAIGPDGARHTKERDLAAYRSGSSVITELIEEDVEVLLSGSTGVTFFTGTLAGTFGGQPMTARMRYTRTWSTATKQASRADKAELRADDSAARADAAQGRTDADDADVGL